MPTYLVLCVIIMSFFRSWFFKILYRLGIGKFLLSANRNRNRVPVLVFHKIIPEYDQIWPGIHPKLFEQIIVMLKKHYTILPLNELYLNENTLVKLKNACFITFDDGYKDFLDYAYPILKKKRAFSTLFVLPHQITNKGHIWTSTIIFFTKHYSFDEIDEFLKRHQVKVQYRNKNDAFLLNLDITVCLCAMLHEQRSVIVNDLRDKFVADNRIIENELLSFEELRMLDPALVDVESHSLTHPAFKNETNIEFIKTELVESKKKIESELNTHVNAFAFPFANFSDLSINLVKKVYKISFTGINDFVNLKRLKEDSDYIYNLPRFNIHHDSAEEVFFLINGFHRKFLKRFFAGSKDPVV